MVKNERMRYSSLFSIDNKRHVSYCIGERNVSTIYVDMTMETKSIKTISHINVVDSTGLEYFGCNQQWYETFWQRLSGCGPSVATTLLLYLQRSGQIDFAVSGYDQTDCKLVMDDIWSYITPTRQGVNTSDLFCEGILRFASDQGFKIECERFVFPRFDEERPELKDAVQFIADGLSHDCPVAFLNLHNGKAKNLEAWHWVSIVALDYDADFKTVNVTIFDGDKSDRIDFKTFYETTKKGGALVSLRVPLTQSSDS